MSSTTSVASEHSLIIRNTGIAAATTLVLNLIIYAIGKGAGWIPDPLPSRADVFGVPSIIAATLIPIVAGGILLTVLIHISHRPVLLFCLIASVVFIVTLFSPLSITGASLSFRLLLISMHLVTFAVGVALLIRNVGNEPDNLSGSGASSRRS